MLTGSMVLKRAMVVGALALSTSPLVMGVADAAVLGTGRSCSTENWVWSGSTNLGPATPFDTGIVVPAVVGTDVTVLGVSADGLSSTGQARAMVVTVGGVAAVTGGVVPGGAIVVLADGEPAQLNGVTVVLERCADVQSGAPGDPSDDNMPSTGATAQVRGSLIGAVAVAVGSAMMVAGRRRAPR